MVWNGREDVKIKLGCFLLSAMMLLAACGNEPKGQSGQSGTELVQEQRGFIGHVVKKDKGRVLVVNDVEKDFSANGGASHYYEAVWFSKASSDIQVGQQVEVWAEGEMEDSYPGQAQADRIAVMETNQPEGARLTESEAVRKALISPEIEDYAAPVIKQVHFDAEASEWRIEIAGSWEEKTLEIKVADIK
ncbi:YobA family protein [Cohnella cholangitidis]|uniref:DUF3221 domain-containing protein n=1 Tax=Cohnella cholangitidis TaxID=2598458 RepID=A0A7G5BUV4_9BACL|nr:YobA family protein [Cohnella cholangitidis]QMV40738.1 DUF3221 domain-containing protein [Cohnella cholangitidis]